MTDTGPKYGTQLDSVVALRLRVASLTYLAATLLGQLVSGIANSGEDAADPLAFIPSALPGFPFTLITYLLIRVPVPARYAYVGMIASYVVADILALSIGRRIRRRGVVASIDIATLSGAMVIICGLYAIIVLFTSSLYM